MSRGIMYHITTDKDCVGSMDAGDFRDHLEALKAEYVVDRDKSDAVTDIGVLAGMLSKAGFDIADFDASLHKDHGGDVPAAVLRTGSKASLTACQVRFFRPMLEELRKEVGKITVEEFATQPASLYAMTRNIDDGYGAAVYLDMGNGPATYTLHGFVRRLSPDTTYFISANTVLMH